MDDEGSYLEQYCENCRDETDQHVSGVSAVATCLRCRTSNAVRSEDDRVGALIQRVREDDAASLERLRESPVPLF
jgi:hypothetical protein